MHEGLLRPAQTHSTDCSAFISSGRDGGLSFTEVFVMNNRHRLWRIFIDECHACMRDFNLPLTLLIRWIRRLRK
jgi:hypothetical protein